MKPNVDRPRLRTLADVHTLIICMSDATSMNSDRLGAVFGPQHFKHMR